MTFRIILLFIFLSLTSCATVLNKSRYKMQITSTDLPAKISIEDTILDLPASLKIKRSKDDLPVVLMTDSSNKNFILKSSLSPTFIFGNLLWAELCPAAYLVDLTNQKRFYFGRSVRLDIHDSATVQEPILLKKVHAFYEKSYPKAKNEFYLSIGLPWINNFYLQPVSEPVKTNTGFWGISAGIDYYYSEKRFFNVSVSAVSDFFVPIPAPVDIEGEYESLESYYLAYSHNHQLRRFSVGYGITAAMNSWNYNYFPGSHLPSASKEHITKSTSSLGIVTNASYQLWRRFFLGLAYRPSLLQLDPVLDLKYEHLVSFELGWKFKI